MFDSLAPLRTNVIVMATFGLLAVLLASIGLYGVASYSVTQRTREIGVRMALGAKRATVLRMVLGQGLLLVALGIVAGLVAAAALMSFVPADLSAERQRPGSWNAGRYRRPPRHRGRARELYPCLPRDANRPACRAANGMTC